MFSSFILSNFMKFLELAIVKSKNRTLMFNLTKKRCCKVENYRKIVSLFLGKVFFRLDYNSILNSKF